MRLVLVLNMLSSLNKVIIIIIIIIIQEEQVVRYSRKNGHLILVNCL